MKEKKPGYPETSIGIDQKKVSVKEFFFSSKMTKIGRKLNRAKNFFVLYNNNTFPTNRPYQQRLMGSLDTLCKAAGNVCHLRQARILSDRPVREAGFHFSRWL